jgi:23S rRNA (cytosine1962-C5)-methyltransferase
MQHYRLLDCGEGTKLEMIGEFKVVRPCPQAIWRAVKPELWNDIDSEFHRTVGEKWVWKRGDAQKLKSGADEKAGLPKTWMIENKEGTTFMIEPNEFGNIGVFAEHWTYTEEIKNMINLEQPVLDLFSYSGSSVMDLALAGAKVTAVDSSRSAMGLYAKNLDSNKIERTGHRLILEDAYKFLAREIRREGKYSTIIMDAPSFGRGTKGEVFSIEKDFFKMVEACEQLLTEDGVLVITNHSPRFTPELLRIFLEQQFKRKAVKVREILQKAETGVELPSGFLCIIS